MTDKQIQLIYDKECSACHFYCQIVRIRQSIGELVLIDAREHPEVLQEITAQGLDIDQGMVLKMNGQLYYGSDAIHLLALLSGRSGVFNRLNYWLFSSKKVAAILCPILRYCRNVLLKILGKTKINNLKQEDNDRF
ncbi:DCC1-like thiol-disulfide oxidoreductase family protein [Marinomonas sp. RSW2]|uniref:DCC1-like thiol-disulfide oxidoreductase family protein n=1 Tax=Marinomonas maritima TaxID=2940935 RepID=A0ABT5WIH8_9GAMM|nr:DCC1-like thiol-disulfide oxidoreductase family protein [Marinomonas maritima]MDE8604616.1 DCC1-like thiol-disulfide oxidoreductase family protein [Marinomonas maritima]